MRKIINHDSEGGTRESQLRVQDLQHPRLGKPRRGLQILDTRMGFPRPSLNVVLDSINLNDGEFFIETILCSIYQEHYRRAWLDIGNSI